jgi:hypothetical protein
MLLEKSEPVVARSAFCDEATPKAVAEIASGTVRPRNDNSPTASRTKRNLIIFLLSVLGSAVLARVVEPITVPPGAERGTPGLGQLLWLVTPLGVVLLLRLLGLDGWGDFGLRPNFKGNGFWWLASVLVFPVAITMSVLMGALLGGIELDGKLFPAFAGALLPALISAAIKNVFEEFAWRGYLAPYWHLIPSACTRRQSLSKPRYLRSGLGWCRLGTSMQD